MTELLQGKEDVILQAPSNFVPIWSAIHKSLKNTDPKTGRDLRESLEEEYKVYSWMSEKCIVGESHGFDDSYCNTRTSKEGFCRYCIRMSRTGRILYAIHGDDEEFNNYKNHLYTHITKYHAKNA